MTDVNQDEAIMAQEKSIEKAIAETVKLISERASLNCLLLEYPNDDKVYQEKIKVHMYFDSSDNCRYPKHQKAGDFLFSQLVLSEMDPLISYIPVL